MEKLGLAAQAGCAHSGAVRQLIQRFKGIGNEGVPWVLPFGDCRNGEPIRAFSGHILQGVDCNIRLFLQKNHFQFLNEKALASDFHQRPVQNLVSLRGDRKELHRKTGVLLFHTVFHIMGLPESQKAFPGGNGNFIFQVPAPFLHSA